MFLVLAAISPVILFHDILNSGISLAVLADALAVGFILFALIEIFSPICTEFFNPAVCMAFARTQTGNMIRFHFFFLKRAQP